MASFAKKLARKICTYLPGLAYYEQITIPGLALPKTIVVRRKDSKRERSQLANEDLRHPQPRIRNLPGR